jgi:hypothetical protein
MPREEYEPMIPVFEQVKTFRALEYNRRSVRLNFIWGL